MIPMMKTPRSLGAALLAFAFSVLLLPSARAGGSIGWEDVFGQIKKDDPFIAKFIESQFEVSKVGSGTRIGRHVEVDPSWNLFRLPPFEFTAKAKGADGGPAFDLTLTDNEDGSWTVAVRRKKGE